MHSAASVRHSIRLRPADTGDRCATALEQQAPGENACAARAHVHLVLEPYRALLQRSQTRHATAMKLH